MTQLPLHMNSDKRRDLLIASVKTAVRVRTNVTSLHTQVGLPAVISTNMAGPVALTPLKQVIVSTHSISRSHQYQAYKEFQSSHNKQE